MLFYVEYEVWDTAQECGNYVCVIHRDEASELQSMGFIANHRSSVWTHLNCSESVGLWLQTKSHYEVVNLFRGNTRGAIWDASCSDGDADWACSHAEIFTLICNQSSDINTNLSKLSSAYRVLLQSPCRRRQTSHQSPGAHSDYSLEGWVSCSQWNYSIHDL